MGKDVDEKDVPKAIFNKTTTDSKDSKFAVVYYEHQYDRYAKLEEQRLTISNIVLTVTTVAFTFGFSQNQSNEVANFFLPLVVGIINIFAILYAVRTINHMRVHQGRAKRILEEFAEPIIMEIDSQIHWTHSYWSRWRIQAFIHVGTAAITFAIPIFYYQQFISQWLSNQNVIIGLGVFLFLSICLIGYKIFANRKKNGAGKKSKDKKMPSKTAG